MRHLPLIALLLIAGAAFSQSTPSPIGAWREHLPYNSAIDVSGGNGKLYAATPFSLLSINKADNLVNRLSRVTGLNETGVSAIHYNESTDQLLIAYTNSNIDILSRGDIINIPDIKRDNIIGDKQVYDVFSEGSFFYLSTGLGVIVIDAERYEVKDSWFIGDGGNPVRVNGFSSDDSYFYAATLEGLKRAPKNALNLADYNNWQLLSGSGNLPTGECRDVIVMAGKPIAMIGDRLFAWNGNNWSLFYEDGWPIVTMNISENRLVLAQHKPNAEARVVIVDANGTTQSTLEQTPAISSPRKGILLDGEPWIADQFQGLSHFTGNSFESFRLNSPEATATGEMIAQGNSFYATSGEVNENWNYQYNGNGIYRLREGQWTNFNRYRFTQLDTLLDFISIAVDKSDQSVWAGSFGGGLLHIKTDESFEIFKHDVLGAAIGDPTSYRVSGLAFDETGNLWVSNYGAPQPLLVRRPSGPWQSFTVPFLLNENALTQVLVDENGYKWIVAVKGGGLICFDDAGSIENIGDDRWKRYQPGAGNGNLPDGEVNCLAKDRNGFIWIGTSDGIGVLQCTQDVFNGAGCEAIWPIVKQGSFAGYLFKGQNVRSIAVDGADRKWVATSNGVWLISATGEEVIYQFTEQNSPLLSNDVRKIAIDAQSGEVYFATSKGICSFRGTATAGESVNSKVLVFPNPVPPGYTGSIAIRGLVNDAIVKITEMDGRLVYQTRAFGGQAIWDGRDYKGRKIASGAYLVLISDDGRSQKAAARIIFISK